MSTGDILVKQDGVFGEGSAKTMNVAAGATAINPGEPVVKNALGDTTVIIMPTNAPVVGTHFLCGIATEASTQTASVAGKVKVMPIMPGTIYKMKPKAPTSWDTQAEYDALVGKRVLIDLTAGVYTILAADNSTYGCVIESMDISKNLGYVAFSFRAGALDLA